MNELLSHMNELGFSVSVDKIPLDGNIHRFDHKGKKDGWFLGFQNHTKKGDTYIVAEFGSWKTGEKEEFKTAMQFSRDDKKIIEQDIAKAQKKLEVQRELAKEEASKDAQELWSQATENPASDYLKRKQIKGLLGTKTHMGSSGREVLVPLRDVDGKLWGIQRVLPDGTKLYMENQRKRGCFHVIPFSDALETEEVIYLAEGFATAASIHEAVGKPVVVGFDSGNLASVAEALKKQYPEKALVVCGDDDRFTLDRNNLPTNPGRLAADEVATKYLGRAVYPVFTKDNGKLTDFNDLHLSEGLDSVRNLILGVKPEFHSVRPLGYADGTYYFITSHNPEIIPLSPAAFTKNTLVSMMPLAYWETNFPSKQSNFSVDQAMDSMMKACRNLGSFDSRMVRGAGVWKDQGRTVVNFGSGVWVDGEEFAYHEFKSKFVYKRSSHGLIPGDVLPAAKLVEFESQLKRLSWKKSESAQLLLGWLMVAPITGSLKWRPHAWVTGPSGSGKTFVLTDIIEKLIGENSIKVKGATTEAGTRQQIAEDAKPVIFDELETDDQRSNDRVKSVIELCRQASAETSGQIVKGSSGGKSIAFSARFAAVVSSIRPNLQHEQDKNRFAVFELERDNDNGFTGDDGIQVKIEALLTEEFARGMFSRSVAKIDLILANRNTFYKVLHAKYNGRFADQYGILLAGYFAAIDDEPVSGDMASWAVDSFIRLDEQASETSSEDETECLNHLLAWNIRDTNGNNVTIAELIERHNNMKNPLMGVSDSHQEALMRYGVKILEPGWIAVQNINPELVKVYRGTKWGAGWSPILSRLPDSEPNKNLRFHTAQKKCVKIKLPVTTGE